MTTTWFALLVAVVLGAIALVVAGMAVRRSRPRLVLLMSVVGGVTALAVIATPVVTVLMPSRDHTVWVLGLGAGEPRFTLEVPHRSLSVEGSRYVFSTDLTWEELLEHAGDQHPSGVTTAEGWWWMGLGDTVFILAPDPEAPEDFIAKAQHVAVDHDGSLNATVGVAFPATAAGRDTAMWGEPLDVGWPLEMWEEFYALIGVQLRDGVFTVPAATGGSAKVLVDEEGIATITRAD